MTQPQPVHSDAEPCGTELVVDRPVELRAADAARSCLGPDSSALQGLRP